MTGGSNESQKGTRKDRGKKYADLSLHVETNHRVREAGSEITDRSSESYSELWIDKEK